MNAYHQMMTVRYYFPNQYWLISGVKQTKHHILELISQEAAKKKGGWGPKGNQTDPLQCAATF